MRGRQFVDLGNTLLRELWRPRDRYESGRSRCQSDGIKAGILGPQNMLIEIWEGKDTSEWEDMDGSVESIKGGPFSALVRRVNVVL